MIQYHQLSLFDVMPDAKVNSFIEQLPSRVSSASIGQSLGYYRFRFLAVEA